MSPFPLNCGLTSLISINSPSFTPSPIVLPPILSFESSDMPPLTLSPEPSEISPIGPSSEALSLNWSEYP